jgi:hypothetical protein
MPENDQVHTIADELAVRKVLDEYCLRLEVNAFEEWLDLFTDDTVYELFGRELRGRGQVSAMLSQAPKGVHLGGPARLNLQGDRAETVQNYVFIASDSDQWNMGWYHRTLVRTGAVWKISHTKVTIGRKGALEPRKSSTVGKPQ